MTEPNLLTTYTLPPATRYKGRLFTDAEMTYMANLKITGVGYVVAKKLFEARFNRPLNCYYWTWEMYKSKRMKTVLERVRDQHEKMVSNEFFSSKVNRVRALTDLYGISKQAREFATCHNIIKTLNEMFDLRKEGDRFYIQNNEYINMTVPELKREIRTLSKRLGPELLKITGRVLDKETSCDNVEDGGDEDAKGNGEEIESASES